MLKQALNPSDAWFASNPPINQEISRCRSIHCNILLSSTCWDYSPSLFYVYLIKFSWHLRHTLTTTQCVKKQFDCHMLKNILTFIHFPTICCPQTGTYGQYDVLTADIDQFPLISMAQIRIWVLNHNLWTKHQTNIDEIN